LGISSLIGTGDGDERGKRQQRPYPPRERTRFAARARRHRVWRYGQQNFPHANFLLLQNKLKGSNLGRRLPRYQKSNCLPSEVRSLCGFSGASSCYFGDHDPKPFFPLRSGLPCDGKLFGGAGFRMLPVIAPAEILLQPDIQANENVAASHLS